MVVRRSMSAVEAHKGMENQMHTRKIGEMIE